MRFCPKCGTQVPDDARFCTNPDCECELPKREAKPAPAPAPASKPAAAPASTPSPAGMAGMAGFGGNESNRTKIGAVQSYSDSSTTTTNNTTNNTTNTTTTNISNIITDDTKKSVVCEISGKKILVTSSVVCPVCNKTVAEQYYIEEKLRCTKCEESALTAYQKYYAEMTANSRVIDVELRSILDKKAESLKLTSDQIKEIEFKIRKNAGSQEAHLSDLQQKDFTRTVGHLVDGRIEVRACLNKISAYAKLTNDDDVQCWYNLLSALNAPKEYLQDLKNSTIDKYWQIYWGFAAACKLRNSTEAILQIENARGKYPGKINDVILAQSIVEVYQGLLNNDRNYIVDAFEDLQGIETTDSDCLNSFLAAFKSTLASKALAEICESGLPRLIIREIMGFEFKKPQETNAPAPAPQKATAQTKAEDRKPAPQKPAEQSKGNNKAFVIDSTAGGPINPQVSFNSVLEDEKKPSGKGKFVGIAVAAIAIAAVAGYLILGKSGDSSSTEAQAVKETVAEEAQIARPSEPTVTEAAAKAEEVTYNNMAEKKAAEKAAAEQKAAQPTTAASKASMASQAASQSNAATAGQNNGPAADVLAKGKAAYESGDYKAAHDYFKEAGNAGNAEACYLLGTMLSTGKGTIAKNTLQSKMWLDKAIKLGYQAK